MTDDELEKIKADKEKSIQILHFTQLNQISPVYYDKTFRLSRFKASIEQTKTKSKASGRKKGA